ncbi:FKBP-type peptidyl-prolyl cis-trans isomerase [Aureispira anguillae]|uniref:Peptidyl-prolyl cis-trans isomerase n=1 Tax=Aureispira anguillae TaxID=2864201 RepID=A0A916DPY6_9BACT|nr:FKBP-type peptidyl-prolyl cis-trans isomerase [Aureispira anguillae]BDS10416.1 FKBP-type peptidyl-prolyl cis-trans isomerase [Aureispira anguillae]
MNQTLIIVVVLVLVAVIGFFVAKNAQQQKVAAAKALEDGKIFLEENAKKEGIIVTNSGLQYEVLREGEGPKPTLSSKVTTHYHGTLADGTVFDSSVKRGQPATFPVSGVIRGWQEGIPLMSVGAKYRFYIPQELAYGMRSPSPAIPPGAMLIFEVELLGFK